MDNKIGRFFCGQLRAVQTAGIFSATVYILLCSWIVTHLFALAVCHKSLNKLEPLYVVTSVAISSIVAIISFALVFAYTPHCFGFDIINYLVFIQLMFGCVLIALNSTLVTIIALVLCRRAYCKIHGHLDRQHKKALCEMLPLLIHPLFFVVSPVLGVILYHFEYNIGYGSRFVVPIITFTFGMVFAISIISHLGVVLCMSRRWNICKDPVLSSINKMGTEENRTVHESTIILTRSSTYYSIPEEV